MTQYIHRTTIDLDTRVLDRARELLGTTTIRETVDRALREVDRVEALRRGADLILAGDPDFITPDELDRIRRNPHYP